MCRKKNDEQKIIGLIARSVHDCGYGDCEHCDKCDYYYIAIRIYMSEDLAIMPKRELADRENALMHLSKEERTKTASEIVAMAKAKGLDDLAEAIIEKYKLKGE